MTLLSDNAIQKLVQTSGLIFPFEMRSLQPCSYDVHLDSRLIRFSGGSVIDAESKIYPKDSVHEMKIPAEGYILDPGEFVLGSTIEGVSIPKNLAARYEGKSSIGRLGLASHVTAGFIDPGFRGDITLEIKNENTLPIRIKAGMAIGQLCFFTLNQEVNNSYGDPILGSHYFNQSGPTLSR